MLFRLCCMCCFLVSVFPLSGVFIKLMLVDQTGHRFNLKGTSSNSVSTVCPQGCCWRTSFLLQAASRRSVLLPRQWHWIEPLSSQEKVCKTAAFVSFSPEVDRCAFYVFIPHQDVIALVVELDRTLLVKKKWHPMNPNSRQSSHLSFMTHRV